MAYTGSVWIDGVEYQCEVIDAVRYIDGVTVETFLSRIDKKKETMERLAKLGELAIALRAEGDKQSDLQGELSAMEFEDY